MQTVTITEITVPELEALFENSIRKILSSKYSHPLPEADHWFDLPELCAYLPDKPAKATIYAYVSAKLIPVHKDKGQKKLRFLKSEIDLWLKQGKKLTVSEIQTQTDRFLSSQKEKGGRL